jgi:hypothetical protein
VAAWKKQLLQSQAPVLLHLLKNLAPAPQIDAFSNELQQEFKIGRCQYSIEHLNAVCSQGDSWHSRQCREEFLEVWNDKPKPFVWHATVESILAKLSGCRQPWSKSNLAVLCRPKGNCESSDTTLATTTKTDPKMAAARKA